MSCSSEKKLLSTFLSRVRREYFVLSSESNIQSFIEYEIKNTLFSPAEKKELQEISAGRSEFLQKMIEDPTLFQREKEKKTIAENILTKTPLEKMKYAEDFSKKEISEIQEILFFLKRYFQKILRKTLSQQSSEISVSEKKVLSSLLHIEKSLQFLSQNGNKRMILEHLFLSL